MSVKNFKIGLISLLLLLAVGGECYSQVVTGEIVEQRESKSKRKRNIRMNADSLDIITLPLDSTVTIDKSKVADTQHYFGVRGGVGGGSITIQPFRETGFLFGFPEFGIVYRYIGGEKWVGGVAFELNMVKTGYQLLPRPKSDSSYNRTMTFLELPIFWHPQYEFANGKMRVFANIGPYISYMLSSKYEYIDKFDRTSDYNHKADYVFNRFFDVRLGYGVIGGIGASVLLLPNLELNIEGRYKFSFSDVWKSAAKIDHNISRPDVSQMFGYDTYIQTQPNNVSVSLGIGYRFMGGKKSALDGVRKSKKTRKKNIDIPPSTAVADKVTSNKI